MTDPAAEPNAAMRALVARELDAPVQDAVADMAAALAARYSGAARAVIFYGSCLREARLDGLMLDFYLIVSDYDAAYGRGWFAAANRWIPPNVFPFEHDGLLAKYAVLDEADLARLCSPAAGDVSVFARFAQPVRLAWAADPAARQGVIAAVAAAPVTLAGAAMPMAGVGESDPLALWRAGFALTYAAELRAERAGRAGSIVDHDPDHYRALTAALPSLPPLSRAAAERLWRRYRRRGKLLTLARLAKATTTYAGGIDYLAWKINRHAGTRIAIQPWQRRWPIVAALLLIPRLIRSGAVK